MTRMASVKAATVAMRSSGQMIVAIEMVRNASVKQDFSFMEEDSQMIDAGTTMPACKISDEPLIIDRITPSLNSIPPIPIPARTNRPQSW